MAEYKATTWNPETYSSRFFLCYKKDYGYQGGMTNDQRIESYQSGWTIIPLKAKELFAAIDEANKVPSFVCHPIPDEGEFVRLHAHLLCSDEDTVSAWPKDREKYRARMYCNEFWQAATARHAGIFENPNLKKDWILKCEKMMEEANIKAAACMLKQNTPV